MTPSAPRREPARRPGLRAGPGQGLVHTSGALAARASSTRTDRRRGPWQLPSAGAVRGCRPRPSVRCAGATVALEGDPAARWRCSLELAGDLGADADPRARGREGRISRGRGPGRGRPRGAPGCHRGARVASRAWTKRPRCAPTCRSSGRRSTNASDAGHRGRAHRAGSCAGTATRSALHLEARSRGWRPTRSRCTGPLARRQLALALSSAPWIRARSVASRRPRGRSRPRAVAREGSGARLIRRPAVASPAGGRVARPNRGASRRRPSCWRRPGPRVDSATQGPARARRTTPERTRRSSSTRAAGDQAAEGPGTPAMPARHGPRTTDVEQRQTHRGRVARGGIRPGNASAACSTQVRAFHRHRARTRFVLPGTPASWSPVRAAAGVPDPPARLPPCVPRASRSARSAPLRAATGRASRAAFHVRAATALPRWRRAHGARRAPGSIGPGSRDGASTPWRG